MKAPLALPSPSQPKARTLPARAVLRPPAKTAVGTPVGSFDQSLKYLLQHHAADFLRFGLGTPASLTVLKPLASSLPSTGREMDGAYLVSLRRPGVPDPERWAVDIEFCRRHQSRAELALDVGEAQVRLCRREQVQVCTLVFDLYGRRQQGAAIQVERYPLGAAAPLAANDNADESSVIAFRRINLRALGHEDLLAMALPALWPLVPLTRDGKTEEALARTTRTIRARRLPDSDKADLLSALRFLAEAENVPVALLNRYIDRKELKMTKGSLYQEIMQEGRQEERREAILNLLVRRLGKVPQTIRSRVMAESRSRVLTSWFNAAADATDATSARKVLERIRAAAPPKTRSRAA